jgi:hypothetical protein
LLQQKRVKSIVEEMGSPLLVESIGRGEALSSVLLWRESKGNEDG